jgi:hypothetical protein
VQDWLLRLAQRLVIKRSRELMHAIQRDQRKEYLIKFEKYFKFLSTASMEDLQSIPNSQQNMSTASTQVNRKERSNTIVTLIFEWVFVASVNWVHRESPVDLTVYV